MGLWDDLFNHESSVENFSTDDDYGDYAIMVYSSTTTSSTPFYTMKQTNTSVVSKEVFIAVTICVIVVLLIIILGICLRKRKCCRRRAVQNISQPTTASGGTGGNAGSSSGDGSDTHITMTQISQQVVNRKNDCKFSLFCKCFFCHIPSTFVHLSCLIVRNFAIH